MWFPQVGAGRHCSPRHRIEGCRSTKRTRVQNACRRRGGQYQPGPTNGDARGGHGAADHSARAHLVGCEGVAWGGILRMEVVTRPLAVLEQLCALNIVGRMGGNCPSRAASLGRAGGRGARGGGVLTCDMTCVIVAHGAAVPLGVSCGAGGEVRAREARAAVVTRRRDI